MSFSFSRVEGLGVKVPERWKGETAEVKRKKRGHDGVGELTSGPLGGI